MGASPKEGTTSLTDLSIIIPKDNCRKQLSFCCLILLWRNGYINYSNLKDCHQTGSMTSNIRQYSSSNLEPFCAVEDKSNIELVDFNFQVCDIVMSTFMIVFATSSIQTMFKPN